MKIQGTQSKGFTFVVKVYKTFIKTFCKYCDVSTHLAARGSAGTGPGLRGGPRPLPESKHLKRLDLEKAIITWLECSE